MHCKIKFQNISNLVHPQRKILTFQNLPTFGSKFQDLLIIFYSFILDYLLIISTKFQNYGHFGMAYWLKIRILWSKPLKMEYARVFLCSLCHYKYTHEATTNMLQKSNFKYFQILIPLPISQIFFQF